MRRAPLFPASRISRQAFSVEPSRSRNTEAACTAATLTIGYLSPMVRAEASLRLDAGRLDHPRVFLDLAPHEYLEFLWRHVHGVVAQADEPVPHRRILQRLARVGRDLAHDPRRDARRAPQVKTQRRIGAFDTRFAGGRYVRQLAVALRRAHREGPNPAALDVRYRRRDRRPVAIHRLAQHRLDDFRRALERDLGDVDFRRVDELLRVEVRAAAHAGMAPVDRARLRLRRIHYVHQGLVRRPRIN